MWKIDRQDTCTYVLYHHAWTNSLAPTSQKKKKNREESLFLKSMTPIFSFHHALDYIHYTTPLPPHSFPCHHTRDTTSLQLHPFHHLFQSILSLPITPLPLNPSNHTPSTTSVLPYPFKLPIGGPLLKGVDEIKSSSIEGVKSVHETWKCRRNQGLLFGSPKATPFALLLDA